MRIKLDENLPARLAPLLVGLGHDVETALSEGLGGVADETIWQTAQREQCFLITQDLDFSDLRRFAPGTHHGILLVRLRTPRRRALIERVHKLFQSEDVGTWAGCFAVATDQKLRVRRAKPNL